MSDNAMTTDPMKRAPLSALIGIAKASVDRLERSLPIPKYGSFFPYFGIGSSVLWLAKLLYNNDLIAEGAFFVVAQNYEDYE
jgi:hypothetical protein